MNILFHKNAWADYKFWQDNDKSIVKKINQTIKAIEENPFEGIGKLEPLKHNLKGLWSRRINFDHRIIYKVEDHTLYIIQCRYNY